MTTFSYNDNIPNGPHNPTVDQPDMLINTQSIDGILAIDHVSFNASNGGTHLQATFSSKNTPSAQTDPQSVLYTGNGAASTVAELFYRNQSGTLLISAVKAFGTFTTISGTGNVAISNAYNVTTPIVVASSGIYPVILTSNVTTGNNVTVFVMSATTSGTQPTYSFSTGTLTINMGGAGREIHFVVLQI